MVCVFVIAYGIIENLKNNRVFNIEKHLVIFNITLQSKKIKNKPYQSCFYVIKLFIVVSANLF